MEPAENNTTLATINNEKIEGLNTQIVEMNNKVNVLINKLDTREQDNSNKDTHPNKNIYDIVLFVIFGLFFILLLESLSKLIAQNISKFGSF